MTRVYIGKFITTHGIQGEMKIRSDFPFKQKAFRVGTHLLIAGKSYQIISYRRHKNYDMVKLEGLTDINQVLPLRGERVYKDGEELHLADDEIVDEDLLTFKVLTNLGHIGIIKEIFLASTKNKIIRIEVEGKEYLVPYQPAFIKKIDKQKKEVEVEWIAW